jgi:hypothetical protein
MPIAPGVASSRRSMNSPQPQPMSSTVVTSVWEVRRRIKSRGAIFRERPVEGEPGHSGRLVDVVHHTEWCCSHAKRALDIAMTSSESGLPIGASGAERERPRANPDSRPNRRSARDWVGQAPVTERACHRSLEVALQRRASDILRCFALRRSDLLRDGGLG